MRKFLFVFLVSLSNILLGQIPRQNDMIAYFPFNGNANDESTNSNNGTILNNGASLTADRFGVANSAYQFSGAAGGGINIGSNIDLSGSYTISAYARLDTDSDFTNFRSVLFGHGTTSTNRGLHLIFGPTVGIRYGHYNNDYDVGIKDNASYYTIWRHYVFVYDGSNHSRKVYIDGQEVTSTDNYSNVDYAGTGNFIIGNHPWGSNQRWDGKIDDFIIWDVPLSNSEIAQLYQNSFRNPSKSKYRYHKWITSSSRRWKPRLIFRKWKYLE